MRVRAVLVPAIVAAGLAAAVGLGSAMSGSAPPLVGERAPVLEGTGLDGEHVALADLRGDVVLVNVWASWCAPCEDEIPVLLEADRRYAGGGLRIVGVATQDRPEAARRAATEWGADAYPNVPDEDGRIAVAWGVRGVPETFVVGRDGTVVDRHIGPVTIDWLDERLEPVIDP